MAAIHPKNVGTETK